MSAVWHWYSLVGRQTLTYETHRVSKIRLSRLIFKTHLHRNGTNRCLGEHEESNQHWTMLKSFEATSKVFEVGRGDSKLVSQKLTCKTQLREKQLGLEKQKNHSSSLRKIVCDLTTYTARIFCGLSKNLLTFKKSVDCFPNCSDLIWHLKIVFKWRKESCEQCKDNVFDQGLLKIFWQGLLEMFLTRSTGVVRLLVDRGPATWSSLSLT